MTTITLGDIFLLDNGSRVVVKKKDRDMKTVTLVSPQGTTSTVFEETLLHCTQVRPSLSWFLCLAPLASSPMTGIEALSKGKAIPLEFLKDWAPSDFHRKGGPFFLNPEVELPPGDVLTLIFANGNRRKYVVPSLLKTYRDRYREKQKVDQPENTGFFGTRRDE